MRSLQDRLSDSWYHMIGDEFSKPYMVKIANFLKQERQQYRILPKSDDVFKAFELTPYRKVKVVILGQNPYPNRYDAHGLAFSKPLYPDIKVPASLRNIFKEIRSDLSIAVSNDTDLSRWSRQGVFLLNTSLTVREGDPNSHLNIGWQNFTKQAIESLNLSPQPIVFMLWGKKAQMYEDVIDTNHHLVLKSAHPSPLSCSNFFGNKHFSKCNNFLEQNNLKPINWS